MYIFHRPITPVKKHELTMQQSLGLSSFAYSFSYLVRNPNPVYGPS